MKNHQNFLRYILFIPCSVRLWQGRSLTVGLNIRRLFRAAGEQVGVDVIVIGAFSEAGIDEAAKIQGQDVFEMIPNILW